MNTSRRCFLTALATAVAGAAPLAAQGVPAAPVRAHAELSVMYAHPLGEFADQIERGFGLMIGSSVPVRPNSPLSLRVDAGVINYGNETREVCLSPTIGCRVRLDLTTSNNILVAGVGPQLALPGGPIRPYIHATAGLAYFGTTSSIRGLDDHRQIAQTTNHDDVTFSWGGGGGMRIALSSGAAPVLLDLGARYHNNGRVEYLRRGDITDLPDGSIVLNPQQSRADLVTFHVGASVGIRPGRQR
jgi:opacity protein-like surface antigen